jgi:hypothetical protein
MKRRVIIYTFGWSLVDKMDGSEEGLIPKLEKHGGIS